MLPVSEQFNDSKLHAYSKYYYFYIRVAIALAQRNIFIQLISINQLIYIDKKIKISYLSIGKVAITSFSYRHLAYKYNHRTSKRLEKMHRK